MPKKLVMVFMIWVTKFMMVKSYKGLCMYFQIKNLQNLLVEEKAVEVLHVIPTSQVAPNGDQKNHGEFQLSMHLQLMLRAFYKQQLANGKMQIILQIPLWDHLIVS